WRAHDCCIDSALGVGCARFDTLFRNAVGDRAGEAADSCHFAWQKFDGLAVGWRLRHHALAEQNKREGERQLHGCFSTGCGGWISRKSDTGSRMISGSRSAIAASMA